MPNNWRIYNRQSKAEDEVVPKMEKKGSSTKVSLHKIQGVWEQTNNSSSWVGLFSVMRIYRAAILLQ